LRSTDLRANRRNFEKAGLAPAFLFAFQLVWISAGWCLLPPLRTCFRLKTPRDPTNR
jgi:hypothetical protein